ncbi:toll/interleukin-1 receptor domain-containing protein [Halomicronema sp. CCY15110]|uniref:toll/interleukin-1 receptor domain-containing protein n=1 Tax=Halomicronema sp. CCY15110 TaxID=2767773 RepID=UPI00194EC8A8|nr:TIR domain-containing protein [Halomicronema sp. CCY15110]
MTKSFEFEIALSFAGEDREYVDQVANLLQDAGVKIFYDKFEEANLWGKNLYDYLTEVYKDKALYTIMFISEHYARKMWTNHERQVMQSRAFQENQEYILPVRFDETPIPGILSTTAYISLKDKKPHEFVEIIQKKLINSGQTIPSESLRRALFSVDSAPRVNPIHAQINVISSEGLPIDCASITAIADNSTTKITMTSSDGKAVIEIPTRRLYRLLVAHPKYPGALISSWDPNDDLKVTLFESENTGSVICHSTCHIPNLQGRLNPILDTSRRTYLYADNVAINGGVQQPGRFIVNEPFELEDCNGMVMQVKVMFIQGRTSLLQYVHPRLHDS